MTQPEYRIFEGVQIPAKLLDYAVKYVPKDKLRVCLNLYKLFGNRPVDTRGRHDNRKLVEQNVKIIEKWTNVYIHRFTEDEVRRLLSIPEKDRETWMLLEIEKDLDGTVMGHRKRDVFNYFKPIINGFIDPAYILYMLATRRPRVYKIIEETDGGFEWIKRMSRKVREKEGMLNNPLMCEVWEMDILMPGSKEMRDKGMDSEEAPQIPEAVILQQEQSGKVPGSSHR